MTMMKKPRHARSKSASTKKAQSPPKPNGDAVHRTIENEGDRFKLEALQLKLQARRAELSAPVIADFNQRCQAAIDRTLRNDMQFKAWNDEFTLLLNQVAQDLSPGEGYTPKEINTSEGRITYVTAASPEESPTPQAK